MQSVARWASTQGLLEKGNMPNSSVLRVVIMRSKVELTTRNHQVRMSPKNYGMSCRDFFELTKSVYSLNCTECLPISSRDPDIAGKIMPLLYELLSHLSISNAYTFRSFNFSPASVAPPPTGATFGFAAVSALPFAFWEVESLGRSLVKGMNSGAPGRYFLSGSGTLNP